ncbi:hypothetical protein STA3757_11040 [Stanieria sp. NIES-3757]|nr:hypothetical protein STA3757_11040 [Stanieria sp. NIES-3757]
MKFSLTSLYNWYRNAIRNPKYRWWIIIGTLIYLVSPIDIAPDFIPIAGQIDDLMLATLLVTELSQLFLDKFKSHRQDVGVSQGNVSQDVIDVEVEPVSAQKS